MLLIEGIDPIQAILDYPRRIESIDEIHVFVGERANGQRAGSWLSMSKPGTI
jgi:hypothetical protein